MLCGHLQEICQFDVSQKNTCAMLLFQECDFCTTCYVNGVLMFVGVFAFVSGLIWKIMLTLNPQMVLINMPYIFYFLLNCNQFYFKAGLFELTTFMKKVVYEDYIY